MKLAKTEIFDEVKKMVDVVHSVGGHFVSVFHNSSFEGGGLPFELEEFLKATQR